ncbi:amidohydrolase [Sporosarcina sp. P19]|uniref:amidohydrolase family protein n=1 Tax=Sporosarcina sp. P19 TaxID=2048258 RepID=UPI000C1733AE|nr:amidohydrolase family protein [Sporosarcina sp. P19]PIC77532.1 amidohydrolase [Sporosarcina sp. P19]
MIIDVSNTVPIFQFEKVVTIDKKNTEYLQLFAPRWAQLLGWPKQKLVEKIKEEPLEDVINELFTQLEKSYSMENFIGMLQKSNVVKHAIHNLDYGRSKYSNPVSHEETACLLKEYKGQFIGFAGYNPHIGTESLKVVKKAVLEQGFEAVAIAPYDHGLHANDKKYYPLYSFCDEHNIPVWIHASINYFKETSVFVDHPKYLEEPLMDFDNLKIIAGHGGWPWTTDLVALCLKYNRLFVDTSAFRPKYIGMENTGWEMFLQYANTLLQDQIVFGSDWLTLGMPIAEFIAEIDSWGLRDEVKEKFFWKNANNLFDFKLT